MLLMDCVLLFCVEMIVLIVVGLSEGRLKSRKVREEQYSKGDGGISS